MKTELFDFSFDDKFIATSPANPRESAKMMCVSDNSIMHKHISDLVDMLSSNDVLVLNNTRVIKARIEGQLTTTGRSAKVTATLHKHLGNDNQSITYTSFIKGAKKIAVHDSIVFKGIDNKNIYADVLEKKDTGEVTLKFHSSPEDFFTFLEISGSMPLPPYIEKYRKADKHDDHHYQTVFAKHKGSVAAPTASLHFTEELLKKICDKNIMIAYVTLHVGGGTFLPVKSDDITDHTMHSELISITQEDADKINHAKSCGSRIVCVGTTALRVIESVSDDKGFLKAFSGETDIFIYPGYQFKLCDVLMTNFHLPKSTLFMLVCAFMGTDTMKSAYQQAMEENYRFFSYGDACFLERRKKN